MAASADSAPQTITDAVVLVPGIMGSELVDDAGRVVWGLTPKVLASRLTSGSKALTELHVTDEDRAGEVRLLPSRLIRFPTSLPILGGMEPYSRMVQRLEAAAIDPRAVSTFPYDWRLPVDHNARLFAYHSFRHLDTWRNVVDAEHPGVDSRDTRVVPVAHSMGGLVVWAACELFGLSEVVRRIVTLGTPYFGSVKAVRMLETGQGAPRFIPREAARKLAVTCPGVYDLLPRYRCVSGSGLRHLTSSDVAGLGADTTMAQEAQGRWDTLGLRERGPGVTQILAVVGAYQPTLQSMTISNGVGAYLESLDGVDHFGDGTVYRQSATPLGVTAMTLPQHHGALAKSPEAVTFVLDKAQGADTAPPLGTGPVGVDVPDMTVAGRPLAVVVHGSELQPHHVMVTSTNVETGQQTAWPTGEMREGTVVCRKGGLSPGLHRVEVKHGGWSAVSEIVLVVPPEAARE